MQAVHAKLYADLSAHGGSESIPVSCMLSAEPADCKRVHSWPTYCAWRSISLSSPTPLLLTWPLTLWHSVERLLPIKPPLLTFARADAATETNTLCILVGGAASVEVAQQACLLELLHLWGAVGRIMVALVGPGVAACKHGSVRVLDNGDKR